MKNKLSVIIPVYNSEKWIANCLDSLLDQVFQNFEVIIINDGSTDGTSNIIKTYLEKDERFRCITTKNHGSALAKNLGLKYISGTIVTFLDADDYIDTMMYESMIAIMEKLDADIVECGCRKINNYGRVLYNVKFIDKKIMGTRQCSIHFMKQKNVGNYMCNKIYKKSLFDNISFPNLRYSEDYYINAILHSKIKKKVILSEIFYNYRVHAEQCTHNKNIGIERLDGIKAGNMLINYFSYDKELKEYAALYACRYALLIAENASRLKKSYSRKFWKNMKDELIKAIASTSFLMINQKENKKIILQCIFLYIFKNHYLNFKWLFETDI